MYIMSRSLPHHSTASKPPPSLPPPLNPPRHIHLHLHLLTVQPPPLVRPLQRQEFGDAARVERGAFGDEDVVGCGYSGGGGEDGEEGGVGCEEGEEEGGQEGGGAHGFVLFCLLVVSEWWVGIVCMYG